MVGRAAFLNAATIDASFAAAGSGGANCTGSCAPLESVIFLKPQEISDSGSNFPLDNQARVVVTPNASPEDLLLARSLVNELGDRFDLHLKIERSTSLQANARTILMGSVENPLVRQYCAQLGAGRENEIPGPEGYILRTDTNVTLVAGRDRRGAFYGLQSLRQLVFKQDGQVPVVLVVPGLEMATA
jgi:hypothetical protein